MSQHSSTDNNADTVVIHRKHNSTLFTALSQSKQIEYKHEKQEPLSSQLTQPHNDNNENTHNNTSTSSSINELKPIVTNEAKPTVSLTSTPSTGTAWDSDKSFKVCGYDVCFPFQPYPTQRGFMARLLTAVKQSKHALLESPTGSGKTLSLLCSALAWQQHEKANYEQMTHAKNTYSDHVMLGLTGQRFTESISSFDMNSPSDDYDPLNDLTQINRNDVFDNMTQLPLVSTPPKTNNNTTPKLEKVKTQARPVVFYLSRTHSQLDQVVQELKTTNYHPKMTVLAARKHYCIHDYVKNQPNINDACKQTQSPRNSNTVRCTYHDNSARVAQHSITDGIFDVEQLVDVGHRVQGCPYYAAQTLMTVADIVFAPYNYVVMPMIRRAMSINLQDALVIFDEAHNAEQIGRDSASCDIVHYDLIIATAELQRAANKHAKSLQPNHKNVYQIIHDIMQNINKWAHDKIESGLTHHTDNTVSDTYRDNEMMSVINIWGINARNVNQLIEYAAEIMKEQHGDTNKLIDASKQVAAEDEVNLSGPTTTVMDNIFSIMEFMFLCNQKYVADYRLNISEDKSSKHTGAMSQQHKHKIGLWCMNPAVPYVAIVQQARSIVLTSGTLSPLTSFASELDINFDVTYEAEHVVAKEQIWCNVVSTVNDIHLVGTYNNVQTNAYKDAVGTAILDIVSTVPDGILVFFSGYSTLRDMITRWQSTGIYSQISKYKRICREESNQDKMTKELTAYNDSNSAEKRTERELSITGGLFLAVCRGKLSEGIDFADSAGRAVVIVGIPYPSSVESKVKLKKEHNNQLANKNTRYLRGDTWYGQQAYRAVNQAIGRTIRHKQDYGSIILLDKRYEDIQHVNNLSKWVRDILKAKQCRSVTLNAAKNSLEQFFEHWAIHAVKRPEKVERVALKDVRGIKGGFSRMRKRNKSVTPSLPTTTTSTSTTSTAVTTTVPSQLGTTRSRRKPLKPPGKVKVWGTQSTTQSNTTTATVPNIKQEIEEVKEHMANTTELHMDKHHIVIDGSQDNEPSMNIQVLDDDEMPPLELDTDETMESTETTNNTVDVDTNTIHDNTVDTNIDMMQQDTDIHNTSVTQQQASPATKRKLTNLHIPKKQFASTAFTTASALLPPSTTSTSVNTDNTLSQCSVESDGGVKRFRKQQLTPPSPRILSQYNNSNNTMPNINNQPNHKYVVAGVHYALKCKHCNKCVGVYSSHKATYSQELLHCINNEPLDDNELDTTPAVDLSQSVTKIIQSYATDRTIDNSTQILICNPNTLVCIDTVDVTPYTNPVTERVKRLIPSSDAMYANQQYYTVELKREGIVYQPLQCSSCTHFVGVQTLIDNNVDEIWLSVAMLHVIDVKSCVTTTTPTVQPMSKQKQKPVVLPPAKSKGIILPHKSNVENMSPNTVDTTVDIINVKLEHKSTQHNKSQSTSQTKNVQPIKMLKSEAITIDDSIDSFA